MHQTSSSAAGHDALIATAILSWTDAKFAAENAASLKGDRRFEKAAWDGGLANPAGGVQFVQTTYHLDPSNTIDTCPSNVQDCFTQDQGCGGATATDCGTVSGCPDPNFTGEWGGCLPATWGASCQTQNSLCEVTIPGNY